MLEFTAKSAAAPGPDPRACGETNLTARASTPYREAIDAPTHPCHVANRGPA
jgi:hypothetical protein